MSELRKDLITGRWIVIDSLKGKNATHFKCEAPYAKTPPECPFCEGNESLSPHEIMAIRGEGSRANEPGWQVRVIPNRYPALKIEQHLVKKGSSIYDYVSGFGAHEIIIDSPDHQKTIKDLSDDQIHQAIAVLQARVEDLYRDQRIRSIVILKNEGPDAGAVFTHPHYQLLATPVITQNLKEHLRGAEGYFKNKERCIYCDIIEEELSGMKRVFYEDDHFVALCPYASRFPFEIWILPKRHESNFFNSRQEGYAFAQVLRQVHTKLSAALENPQFNLMIMTAPNPVRRKGSWQTLSEDFHWHAEIIPVLAKTQSYDRCTGFHINPTSPEEAARFLRETPVLVS